MKKRFVLRRRSLFGTVIGITAAVVVYLTLWMVVDPPQEHDMFELSTETSSNSDAVVIQQSFCSSNNTFWRYVTLVWYCILLLCATVLAFQTRGHRQEFNESKTLAVMIYSHSVFLVLRIINAVFFTAVADEVTVWQCQSIIISVDVIATIVIYFVPKFFTSDEDHRRKSFTERSTSFWAKRSSHLGRDDEAPNDDEVSDVINQVIRSVCKTEVDSNGIGLSDDPLVPGGLARESSHSFPGIQRSSDDVQPAEDEDGDSLAAGPRKYDDIVDDNERAGNKI
jgi:hypothetical protein